MDLRLYLRVLRRFWPITILGILLAVGLAFLAYVRVDYSEGKVDLTYRGSEQWVAYTTLMITRDGFPWGSAGVPNAQVIPSNDPAGRRAQERERHRAHGGHLRGPDLVLAARRAVRPHGGLRPGEEDHRGGRPDRRGQGARRCGHLRAEQQRRSADGVDRRLRVDRGGRRGPLQPCRVRAQVVHRAAAEREQHRRRRARADLRRRRAGEAHALQGPAHDGADPGLPPRRDRHDRPGLPPREPAAAPGAWRPRRPPPTTLRRRCPRAQQEPSTGDHRGRTLPRRVSVAGAAGVLAEGPEPVGMAPTPAPAARGRRAGRGAPPRRVTRVTGGAAPRERARDHRRARQRQRTRERQRPRRTATGTPTGMSTAPPRSIRPTRPPPGRPGPPDVRGFGRASRRPPRPTARRRRAPRRHPARRRGRDRVGLSGAAPIELVAIPVVVGAVALAAARLMLGWTALVGLLVLVILFIPLRRYKLPGDAAVRARALPRCSSRYRGRRVGARAAVGPRVRLRRSGIGGSLACVLLAITGLDLANPGRCRGPLQAEVVKAVMFFVQLRARAVLVVSVCGRRDDRHGRQDARRPAAR